MTRIAVRGSRSDRGEWESAQNTPKEQLPPLTSEQRSVAEQMHIPEEDYQRIALAGRRTAEKLLKKTEWFAKALQKKVMEKVAEAVVESVVLDTWENKFEIAIRANGATIPLHVAEGMVDDLFDLGSANAAQRLSEMLEECFHRLGVL